MHMDLSTILVRVVGLFFLGWTGYSVFKHVKALKAQRAQNKGKEQSMSEELLNNIILYLWLAFMTMFSIGMIVNN